MDLRRRTTKEEPGYGISILLSKYTKEADKFPNEIRSQLKEKNSQKFKVCVISGNLTSPVSLQFFFRKESSRSRN
jgi:hypothetical protein